MSRAAVIETPVEADRLAECLDYAIIGPTDGRWRVRAPMPPPYSSICHIARDFGTGGLSGCTAFLIAPRVLLTAGHCLFSLARRRTPRRILVTPARDGASRPYGAAWAEQWYVHPRFAARADPRLDWGIIRLSRGFGLEPGLRLAALSSEALERVRSSRLLRIAGYPSDKAPGELWAHAERLDGFGRHLMRYSVDTCPGHSGAPVWLDGANAAGAVIAIHTRGPRPSARGPWGCRPGAPNAPPGHFNAGVRVTAPLLAAVASSLAGNGPLAPLRPSPPPR
ncbi:trypsin-like serine peptidase [Amaricoccus solimangrovi]|uniref:Serine protease n=1 Tax=Amaricoccus solimangrovi TaxID=2589815 RepID=A0A501WX01_9RHOB|nr:trypsin-like serine protease [Amaricoccus solimangrovi]TPE53242.1 trypsin-like serine protease [Amaricoccus solimangrovi]